MNMQPDATSGDSYVDPTPGDAVDGEGDGLETLKMLWRWKGLAALGLLLGLAIGYLVYIQMPAQYTSTAMIQILTPNQKAVPAASLDLGESAVRDTRHDDIIIIQNERVVLNAIEVGKLAQNEMLAGMSPMEIYAWIVDKDRLVVEPGSDKTPTDLIRVSFTCTNRDLATEVVQALLAGYQEYLREIYLNRGGEVVEKIAGYEEKYKRLFSEASKQYIELRKNLPGTWNGDDTIDNFAEKAFETNRRISQLNFEIKEIEGLASQAAAMIEAKRSPEVIMDLLMMNKYLVETLGRGNSVNEIIAKDSAITEDNRTIQQLQAQILDAELERDQYRSFGANYPKTVTLTNQIEELQKRLDEARDRDAERKAALREQFFQTNSSQTPADRVQNALAALTEQRQNLLRQRESLAEMAIEDEQKSRALQAKLAEIEVRKRDMDLVDELARELTQAVQGLEMGNDYNRKTMEIQSSPSLAYQSAPKLLHYLGGGGLAGLLLFCGLAYLLELADRSYRTPEEILRSLKVPVLGHISIFEADRRDQRDPSIDPSVVTFHKPQCGAAECYRGIRTSLFFARRKTDLKTIQVTSPLPGDGKSTLAVNIAVSLAQSGRPVLFIDCDLRRPRGAKIFGLQDNVGVSSCLMDEASTEEAIQRTAIDNLSVMTSGPRVPNPSELLVYDDFERLLRELRERYSYIIIDTPPMLSVSDPGNIAPIVDGVLMTMRLRRNSRTIAEQAKNILTSINANVLGVVVNGVGANNNYGYGGYRYDNSGSAGYTYGAYGGYGYSDGSYGDEKMQAAAAGPTRPRSSRRKVSSV